MIAALVIGGYFLVMLLTGRFVYQAMREDSFADGIDAAMDGAMAFFVSLAWPLALPVAIIMWHPKPTAAEARTALSEREMENLKLQRRITELERELGIGAS